MDRPENELPDRERPDRTPVEELRDWETIQQNGDDDYTQRLVVVGGCLYRTMTVSGVALVFAPNPQK